MITGQNIKELTEARIKNLLNGHREAQPFSEIALPERTALDPARCAAVLIPLVQLQEDWMVLLIRRTDTVADHKGQVAFPGGACEENDTSLEATALREMSEEIGVPQSEVRILGRLRDLITVSRFNVTPVVGTFRWPYPLALSSDEVSRAFTIPLAWLADPENQETRKMSRLGREIDVIYFKPYDGEILWGATARMVNNMLESLKLKE